MQGQQRAAFFYLYMYISPMIRYGETGCQKKLLNSWDQRQDVENDEKYYGMFEKCCDAGRGSIDVCLMFGKDWHRDVRCHRACSRRRLMTS